IGVRAADRDSFPSTAHVATPPAASASATASAIIDRVMLSRDSRVSRSPASPAARTASLYHRCRARPADLLAEHSCRPCLRPLRCMLHRRLEHPRGARDPVAAPDQVARARLRWRVPSELLLLA